MGFQPEPEKTPNQQLISACEDGNTTLVGELLNVNNISQDTCNLSLRIACKDDHLEVVKLLLSDDRVDPTVNKNMPIFLACLKGHLEVVVLLMLDDRVDPSDNKCSALDTAMTNKHLKIIECILQDKNVVKYVRQNWTEYEERCRELKNHDITLLIFSVHSKPKDEEDQYLEDLCELLHKKKKENCKTYLKSVMKQIEICSEDTLRIESLSGSHVEYVVELLKKLNPESKSEICLPYGYQYPKFTCKIKLY